MRRSLAVSTLLASFATLLPFQSARALEIYAEFPAQIRADERYVFYSHGAIVEGDDPRPVHEQFGVYDFPAVKATIFADGGFNLIAYHRPKGTEIGEAVDTLVSSVRQLLTAGVPPARITIVGFSRGAQITAHASSRLKETGVGTVLMGLCADGDFARVPPMVLGGHVLSIYETTDVVRSCERLAARSDLESFEEIAISTGRGHGAFYQPLPEWVEPLKKWLAATNR